MRTRERQKRPRETDGDERFLMQTRKKRDGEKVAVCFRNFEQSCAYGSVFICLLLIWTVFFDLSFSAPNDRLERFAFLIKLQHILEKFETAQNHSSFPMTNLRSIFLIPQAEMTVLQSQLNLKLLPNHATISIEQKRRRSNSKRQEPKHTTTPSIP
jgi:hypothetical protein